MNVELYAAWPPTVTEKVPEDAPAGTIAVIVVVFHVATTADVPLSVTVPVVPKFVPVISTGIPTGPVVGDMLVIVGA